MALKLSPVQREKLFYTQQFTSMRGISRQANISRHKLNELRFKGIALTGTELKRFNNLTRKYAYADLRNKGFNTRMARRFQGASVDVIRITKSRYDGILDYLSNGTYIKMKERRDRLGIAYNDENLYQEAVVLQREGLGRSKKTVEDWENY